MTPRPKRLGAESIHLRPAPKFGRNDPGLILRITIILVQTIRSASCGFLISLLLRFFPKYWTDEKTDRWSCWRDVTDWSLPTDWWIWWKTTYSCRDIHWHFDQRWIQFQYLEWKGQHFKPKKEREKWSKMMFFTRNHIYLIYFLLFWKIHFWPFNISEMGSNVVSCAFVYVFYPHGQKKKKKKKKKKKGLAQAVIQIFCSQGSLKYEQCGAMIP